MALSWKAPASIGGSAILRYERRHRLGTSSTWPAWTGASTATSATVPNLTNDQEYRFEVRAVNAAGEGPSAGVSQTPRKPNQPPVLTGPATASFDEHATGTVATYTATDPDNHSLTWSLAGADAGAFTLGPGSSQRALSFSSPPDYEVKSSYQVTVRVKDTPGDSAQVAVTVTVNNLDEAGSVSTNSKPKVGDRLIAVLTDPDKGVSGVSWTWQQLQPLIGGQSSWEDLAPDPGILGASSGSTSPPYTVKSTDFGLVLQAKANYTDAQGPDKVARVETAPVIKEPSVVRELKAVSGNGQVSLSWKVPVSDGGSAIIRYERRHRLDTSSSWPTWTGSNTVTSATVPNLTNDQEYRFEVRAVNAAGAGSAAGVTATPRKPNQPPVLTGPATASFDEHATGTVATYTATDPDNHSLTWSLAGADAGAFTLGPGSSQRALSFSSPPDYEVKSSYQVTVRVKDTPGDSAQVAVTVTVNNLDEAGSVSTNSKPKVGDRLIAVLTDPDKGVSGVSWTWQQLQPLIGGQSSWEDLAPDPGILGASSGSTSPPYTVKSTDFGLVLQAKANYTDAQGPDKVARVETAPVIKEPSVVRELKAVSGNGQVSLSWKVPVSDGGSAIIRYERRHRLDTSSSWPTWTGSNTVTSATVPNLTNDQEYRFEVRAVNAAGAGSAAGVTATPRKPNRAPVITSGPTRVSFTENGTDSVAIYVATDADNDNISWSDEHTDAGDFTISASGVLRFSSTPDFENPRDSNRNNVYVVRVKATDDGDPAKSATRSVTVTVTDVNEPPRTPGAPSVSAPSSNGHNRLSVTWSAPSNSGRPDIDDYDVQFRPSTATGWSDHSFSGTGTTTTILNLSANTLYYVQVRAKNAEGDGSWSSSGSGRTSAAPNRAPVITSGPTRVSFTENGTGDVATYVATDADNDNISWSDEHTDAGDFTISSSGVLRFSSPPDFETPRDSNRNNIYVVRVKATDDGDPAKSATRTVQVTVKDTDEPPRKPSAPSVSATASNGHERLSVSWSAPANTGPPIDDYDVRYRRSGSSSWRNKSFAGTGTSTTLTGLSGGTLYYVQVRAENPEGDGSWSSSGSGRTINRAPTITSGPDAGVVHRERQRGGGHLHRHRPGRPQPHLVGRKHRRRGLHDLFRWRVALFAKARL